ncbi:MAG: enoyl-CoA hydratase/isomerase family protein [Planctomycetia bacterium]|nr:enoyl-CoA hydratase/isomerase family protein [Planctomycetia bacterium]
MQDESETGKLAIPELAVQTPSQLQFISEVESALARTSERPCYRVDTSCNVAVLVLNRPRRCNAFSLEMLTLLRDELNELKAREDIDGLMIVGKGNAFCSGLDLDEAMQPGVAGGDPPGLEMVRLVVEILRQIMTQRQYVVAVGQRVARGGGAALMCLADYKIVDIPFTLAFPEAKLGFDSSLLRPFLSRLVGPRDYKTLCSGTPVNSWSAKKMGLVDEVTKTEELVVKVGLRCYFFGDIMKSVRSLNMRDRDEFLPSRQELKDAVELHWRSWSSPKAQKRIREFLDGKR